MGGFNPPVPQQDNNWEIRVTVLLSLLLQVLLVFAAPLRKCTSSPVARFAIWSCYLLADWVADLALGLLLNNMGNIGGSRPGGSSSSLTSSVGGHTSTDGSSPVIFAFWTPFLLLHLGGQDTITAYSIEDNELWLRHLVGLLFELFSAAVIFFCSLKTNPMIPATVLIFVVGIIKYGERTYSLYSSSVDGVLANILGDPDPGPNYAKLMTVFGAKEKAGLPVEIVIANGEAKKAHDALEQGKPERDRLVETSTKSLEAQAYELFLIFRRVSYDVNLSYKDRKISQAYFLEDPTMTPTKAFEVIEVELNFLYDMVHTKAPVAHTKAGLALRFVGSGCLVSALAIFFLLDKQGSIQRVDVGITYALILGGLALDAIALAMLLSSNRMLVFVEETPRLACLAQVVRLLRRPRRQRRWSETTSLLNLISCCLGKPDGKDDEGGGRCSNCCFAKFAEKLRVREIFGDFFFIRRERLSSRKQQGEEGEEGPLLFKFIRRERLSSRKQQGEEGPLLLKFIFERLSEAAKEAKGKEYQDMKDTCNYRGEGVLVHDKELHGEIKHRLKEVTRGEQRDLDEAELAKKTKEKMDILVGSLKRDFDESLLLWHIATDLCLLPFPEDSAAKKDTAEKMKPIGKTLSEYMLYLLIKQPEMLSATAGIGLLRYRDTCAEARRFFRSADAWGPDHADARTMLLTLFRSADAWDLDHADARTMLLRVNTSKKPLEVKGDRSKSVLFDACILAKVLRELGWDIMWEVVARVWGEMLTYAASKCRGSTHVRQLSRGGELITLVWFLMSHMGIGDMYQIQEGDATAKLIVHDQ